MLSALFLDLLAYAVKRSFQLLRRYRFQQVFPYTERDRFLCIGEIIVAGKDDSFHPRHRSLHFLAQTDAVHERHPDVGQQNIRVQVTEHRQRHLSVRRLSDQLITFFFPWKGIPQVFADRNLIIHEKHFHHCRFPLLSGLGL